MDFRLADDANISLLSVYQYFIVPFKIHYRVAPISWWMAATLSGRVECFH